jgi:hypothetical protein
MAKQRRAAGDLLAGRFGYLHGWSVKKELMIMYHVHARNQGLVFGRVAVRDVFGLRTCAWPGWNCLGDQESGAGFHIGDILVYRVANGDMMQVHDPRDITRVMEKGVCCVADRHEAKTYRNWFPGGDVCGLRNRKIGTGVWSPGRLERVALFRPP